MRLLAVVSAISLTTGLLAGAAQAAPTPTPTPSASGADTRGVNVTPAPDSPYKVRGHEYVALGVQPPGTLLSDTLVLLNPVAHPQSVYLYAADGSPAVGGGFGYTLRGQPVSRIGAWVRLPASTVTVPAQASVRVPWSIRIPSNAAGGRYVGAIVAEPVGQAVTAQFSAVTRFAMAITLTVSGGPPNATPGVGRPDGRLRLVGLQTRPSGGRLCPTVSYANDSQDVVNPVGTVVADGPLSDRASKRVANLGAVAPGQTLTAPLPCVQRPLGPGRLVVTLSSPHGSVTRAVQSLWLPVPLLVSLFLLLLVLAALLATYLRRRRPDRPSAVKP